MVEATEQATVDSGVTDPGTPATEALTSPPDTGQTSPEPVTTAPATTPEPASDESFYDPTQIPPDLMPAYKQMQGAFTRRMQGISQDKQSMAEKVTAYDQFMANPQETIRQLAAQYGLNLPQQQGQGEQSAGEWQPEDWQQATDHIAEAAHQRVMAALEPIIGQVKQTRQSQIEAHLDTAHPDWREYEDVMTDNLRKHPTLVNDPSRLYQLSVPQEVHDRRAAQAALKRLEKTSTAATVSGPSTTTQQPAATSKVTDFRSAAAVARQRCDAGEGVA